MSDDYVEYNGDTLHDMWVDYTYQEYTGELNDWNGSSGNSGPRPYRYSSKYQPPKSTSQLIAECRSRINSYKAHIANLEVEIERTKKSAENPAVPPGKKSRCKSCSMGSIRIDLPVTAKTLRYMRQSLHHCL